MGKGSANNSCRPAFALHLTSSPVPEPLQVANKFPQLKKFLYPSEHSKNFRGGETLYCLCPVCKNNFVLIASALENQIANGVCKHCNYGHELLHTNFPEIKPFWSMHNDLFFEEALCNQTNVAYVWKCSHSHQWISTVKDLKSRGCPACNHQRWTKLRLQAMMLGEILKQQEALNKNQWTDLFLDWDLFAKDTRPNQAKAMAHQLVQNFPDYQDYDTQIWFSAQPHSKLEKAAQNMNMRILGGQIVFPKSFRIKMWEEAGMRCSNQWCAFGYQENQLPYDHMHIDHIVPLAKGGAAKDQDNLQVLCRGCNLNKSDQMPHVWQHMQKQQYKSKASQTLLP